MQTRLSVCAVSPETHSPLQPQQSHCGEQERDQLEGGEGKQWFLCGCWGPRGLSSFSGLERERLGQRREFWTGGIQLIRIEESISNFRTERRLDGLPDEVI